MSKNAKIQEPTHDEIAARAQSIYEREGRPQGRAMQHWLQAETQLNAERKNAAEAPSSARSTASKPTAAQTAGKPLRGNDWQTTGRQSVHSN
jgi:hypothetical protein